SVVDAKGTGAIRSLSLGNNTTGHSASQDDAFMRGGRCGVAWTRACLARMRSCPWIDGHFTRQFLLKVGHGAPDGLLSRPPKWVSGGNPLHRNLGNQRLEPL